MAISPAIYVVPSTPAREAPAPIVLTREGSVVTSPIGGDTNGDRDERLAAIYEWFIDDPSGNVEGFTIYDKSISRTSPLEWDSKQGLVKAGVHHGIRGAGIALIYEGDPGGVVTVRLRIRTRRQGSVQTSITISDSAGDSPDILIPRRADAKYYRIGPGGSDSAPTGTGTQADPRHYLTLSAAIAASAGANNTFTIDDGYDLVDPSAASGGFRSPGANTIFQGTSPGLASRPTLTFRGRLGQVGDNLIARRMILKSSTSIGAVGNEAIQVSGRSHVVQGVDVLGDLRGNGFVALFGSELHHGTFLLDGACDATRLTAWAPKGSHWGIIGFRRGGGCRQEWFIRVLGGALTADPVSSQGTIFGASFDGSSVKKGAAASAVLGMGGNGSSWLSVADASLFIPGDAVEIRERDNDEVFIPFTTGGWAPYAVVDEVDLVNNEIDLVAASGSAVTPGTTTPINLASGPNISLYVGTHDVHVTGAYQFARGWLRLGWASDTIIARCLTRLSTIDLCWNRDGGPNEYNQFDGVRFRGNAQTNGMLRVLDWTRRTLLRNCIFEAIGNQSKFNHIEFGTNLDQVPPAEQPNHYASYILFINCTFLTPAHTRFLSLTQTAYRVFDLSIQRSLFVEDSPGARPAASEVLQLEAGSGADDSFGSLGSFRYNAFNTYSPSLVFAKTGSGGTPYTYTGYNVLNGDPPWLPVVNSTSQQHSMGLADVSEALGYRPFVQGFTCPTSDLCWEDLHLRDRGSTTRIGAVDSVFVAQTKNKLHRMRRYR